jgi:hypothetical protein
MRNARDVLVAGIGFLLGMVFCYFLMVPKSGPQIGSVAMNPTRPLPILQTPMAAVAPTGHVSHVFPDPGTFQIISDPDWSPRPKGMHRRIVPALSPHGDGAYDLIDLNYVPDFRIDLD